MPADHDPLAEAGQEVPLGGRCAPRGEPRGELGGIAAARAVVIGVDDFPVGVAADRFAWMS
jgi:hypothetical protein